MILIIKIIVLLLFIEFTLSKLFKIFRNNFQWFIIKEFDLRVKPSDALIKKFYKNSFDKSLGWSPKPYSVKFDEVKSFGEKSKRRFIKVKYRINRNSERYNPKFEKKKKKIFTFGDSFVFARHVNDNDTWQNRLSFLTHSNVVNYGVGNYGVDQSILRIKKTIKNKKKKIVILGFVPETIVRIHSCWRHFYEYGNLFAFKPRFILKKQKLKLIKNPIQKIKDLYEIKKKIYFLKKNDYWYEKKFKFDLMHPPFLYSIFKNFPKNIILIYYLTLSNFFKSYTFHNKAWKMILNENSKFVYKSYLDKEMVNLMIEQIKYFSKIVKKVNGIPIVIIFPYLHDLNHILRGNKLFYSNLILDISKYVNIIDLSKSFLKKKDKDKFFVNSYYGSHLSKAGNKYCASEIYSYLKKKKFLKN